MTRLAGSRRHLACSGRLRHRAEVYPGYHRDRRRRSRHPAGRRAAIHRRPAVLRSCCSPSVVVRCRLDVARCSHGATVGPVDPEQIFYLQARGIPAEAAERMLVEGFYSEVLERVPSDQLKERVRRVLQQKLKIEGEGR